VTPRSFSTITEPMKRMLLGQRLGFVATVCPDGTPNLSPKGTIMPWDETHLVFAHLYSPRTVANLRANSGIEINVVDVFSRKGFRFKGRAEVLERGFLFEQVMDLYRNGAAHDPLRDADRRVKAIVYVTVQSIAELISPAYDDGASESAVIAEWSELWAARASRALDGRAERSDGRNEAGS
jgi:predicted pyridoxine 5'-phosphate oxidase superfamily flavin-nucleotide-binding protein